MPGADPRHATRPASYIHLFWDILWDSHTGGNPVCNCVSRSKLHFTYRQEVWLYTYLLCTVARHATNYFANGRDTEFCCVQNFVKRFLPFGKPRDQSLGPTLHTWVRCRRSLSRSCEPVCQHKQLTGPFSPPREVQLSIATLKNLLFYVCGYSFYICCILQLGITVCP